MKFYSHFVIARRCTPRLLGCRGLVSDIVVAQHMCVKYVRNMDPVFVARIYADRTEPHQHRKEGASAHTHTHIIHAF